MSMQKLGGSLPGLPSPPRHLCKIGPTETMAVTEQGLRPGQVSGHVLHDGCPVLCLPILWPGCNGRRPITWPDTRGPRHRPASVWRRRRPNVSLQHCWHSRSELASGASEWRTGGSDLDTAIRHDSSPNAQPCCWSHMVADARSRQELLPHGASHAAGKAAPAPCSSASAPRAHRRLAHEAMDSVGKPFQLQRCAELLGTRLCWLANRTDHSGLGRPASQCGVPGLADCSLTVQERLVCYTAAC